MTFACSFGFARPSRAFLAASLLAGCGGDDTPAAGPTGGLYDDKPGQILTDENAITDSIRQATGDASIEARPWFHIFPSGEHIYGCTAFFPEQGPSRQWLVRMPKTGSGAVTVPLEESSTCGPVFTADAEAVYVGMRDTWRIPKDGSTPTMVMESSPIYIAAGPDGLYYGVNNQVRRVVPGVDPPVISVEAGRLVTELPDVRALAILGDDAYVQHGFAAEAALSRLDLASGATTEIYHGDLSFLSPSADGIYASVPFTDSSGPQILFIPRDGGTAVAVSEPLMNLNSLHAVSSGALGATQEGREGIYLFRSGQSPQYVLDTGGFVNFEIDDGYAYWILGDTIRRAPLPL